MNYADFFLGLGIGGIGGVTIGFALAAILSRSEQEKLAEQIRAEHQDWGEYPLVPKVKPPKSGTAI